MNKNVNFPGKEMGGQNVNAMQGVNRHELLTSGMRTTTRTPHSFVVDRTSLENGERSGFLPNAMVTSDQMTEADRAVKAKAQALLNKGFAKQR